MTMDVAEKLDVSALKRLLDHLFHCHDLLGVASMGQDPLPVEVAASQVGSVVAHDHPVRVEHGHYFEDICIS